MHQTNSNSSVFHRIPMGIGYREVNAPNQLKFLSFSQNTHGYWVSAIEVNAPHQLKFLSFQQNTHGYWVSRGECTKPTQIPQFSGNFFLMSLTSFQSCLLFTAVRRVQVFLFIVSFFLCVTLNAECICILTPLLKQ